MVLSSHANADDKALAEELFRQGSELFAQDRFEDACAKFAASQRIEPSSGTALNLARCYERVGKTASAWAEYEEAARIASVQRRPDRVEEARRRADALKSQLHTLTLTVEGPVPQQTVQIGDQLIPRAAWGTPLPFDPGQWLVVVRAPGYESHRSTLEVSASQRHQRLVVAQLSPLSQDEPVESVRTSTAPTSTAPTSAVRAHGAKSEDRERFTRRQRTAFVTGAIGLTLVAVGAAFGVTSKVKYDQAKRLCDGGTSDCPDDALSARKAAEVHANLSNVTLGIGAAGIVAGGILLGTARSASQPKGSSSAKKLSVSVAGSVGPRGFTWGLEGRFP